MLLSRDTKKCMSIRDNLKSVIGSVLRVLFSEFLCLDGTNCVISNGIPQEFYSFLVTANINPARSAVTVPVINILAYNFHVNLLFLLDPPS